MCVRFKKARKKHAIFDAYQNTYQKIYIFPTLIHTIYSNCTQKHAHTLHTQSDIT